MLSLEEQLKRVTAKKQKALENLKNHVAKQTDSDEDDDDYKLFLKKKVEKLTRTKKDLEIAISSFKKSGYTFENYIDLLKYKQQDEKEKNEKLKEKASSRLKAIMEENDSDGDDDEELMCLQHKKRQQVEELVGKIQVNTAFFSIIKRFEIEIKEKGWSNLRDLRVGLENWVQRQTNKCKDKILKLTKRIELKKMQGMATTDDPKLKTVKFKLDCFIGLERTRQELEAEAKSTKVEPVAAPNSFVKLESVSKPDEISPKPIPESKVDSGKPETSQPRTQPKSKQSSERQENSNDKKKLKSGKRTKKKSGGKKRRKSGSGMEAPEVRAAKKRQKITRGKGGKRKKNKSLVKVSSETKSKLELDMPPLQKISNPDAQVTSTAGTKSPSERFLPKLELVSSTNETKINTEHSVPEQKDITPVLEQSYWPSNIQSVGDKGSAKTSTTRTEPGGALKTPKKKPEPLRQCIASSKTNRTDQKKSTFVGMKAAPMKNKLSKSKSTSPSKAASRNSKVDIEPNVLKELTETLIKKQHAVEKRVTTKIMSMQENAKKRKEQKAQVAKKEVKKKKESDGFNSALSEMIARKMKAACLSPLVNKKEPKVKTPTPRPKAELAVVHEVKQSPVKIPETEEDIKDLAKRLLKRQRASGLFDDLEKEKKKPRKGGLKRPTQARKRKINDQYFNLKDIMLPWDPEPKFMDITCPFNRPGLCGTFLTDDQITGKYQMYDPEELFRWEKENTDMLNKLRETWAKAKRDGRVLDPEKTTLDIESIIGWKQKPHEQVLRDRRHELNLRGMQKKRNSRRPYNQRPLRARDNRQNTRRYDNRNTPPRVQLEKIDELCFFWKTRGYCKAHMERNNKRQKPCPRNHPPALAKERHACFYFNNQRGCHRGDSCNFSHKFKDNPCPMFYAKKLTCKEGDKCKWNHDFTKEEYKQIRDVWGFRHEANLKHRKEKQESMLPKNWNIEDREVNPYADEDNNIWGDDDGENIWDEGSDDGELTEDAFDD